MSVDRRFKFRQGLSYLYTPYYDALCELLPPEWQPYCGLRSFSEQDQLWRQGRETKGSVVTNAKGGASAHNYGCASDWCLWEEGKPIWPGSSDKKWQTYIQAIEKVGLKGGFFWGDFPHNELSIACGWPHVLVVFNQNGMRAAQEHIEKNLAGRPPAL